jgi:choline dehydrogenase-like flavoprotein
MQTVIVRRFQDPEHGLHGPWIESAPAHLGLAALGLPWLGAAAHRGEMQRVAFAAATIVLVRDVGSGSVRVDAGRAPRVSYLLADHDRRALSRGLVEAARITLAAGASRVSTLHQAGCSTTPSESFDAFDDRVRGCGVWENELLLFSAHPTGTLRLGDADPESFGRSTGESWEVDGLYVADGSALPSAPGVNPMLSILALARRTADHVDQRLRRGR